MSGHGAFELLHEGVRRQLWKMQWPALRPLQERSVRHILTSTGHAVLSAGTASGKTEAAFLPVLSAIAEEPAGSIRALYVGPLKALINDQFSRLEALCTHLDMPVHRWHGDVPAADKTKLVKDPGGVLLITPESLESLFVNRSHALTKLFGGLRFVVIDELHSFLGNERGRHLRSLLYRAARLAETPPRMIGLSATIGEPRHALEYLDRDAPALVKWIEGDKADSEVLLKVHTYENDAPADASDEALDAALADRDHAIAADVVKHCRGNTNLVFANARADVEFFGDRCNRSAAGLGLSDRFLVHHGSLTAATREDAEQTMKQASRGGLPATAFCTSTLEMGIDIGNVTMVGQIGAPASVAALKQRVGRSGRRAGAARKLRCYVRCARPDERTELLDRLHLELIQTIAVTELMLQHWVEPAEPSGFDLSTLTQQVISKIAETGGGFAAELHQALCVKGVFRDVDAGTFARLLRELARGDVIEQTSRGDLILGLVGERLRKDKGFYAAFPTSDGYAVLHAGERIGTVDSAPEPRQHLLLSGRRWLVVDVDEDGKLIFVTPASGFKAALFSGGPGVLHDDVVRMMRTVLAATDSYRYLDPSAVRLLAAARDVAAAAGLGAARVVSLGPKECAVMTWLGGRATATLAALLSVGGATVHTEIIAVVVRLPLADCERLVDALPDVVDAATLLPHLSPAPAAKYDGFVGDDLRDELKKRCWLDPAAPAKFKLIHAR